MHVRRLARDESGAALVIALGMMFILAGLTAALLFAVAVNQRSAYSSSSARAAFALAETALAYGEGAVYSAGQSGQTPPAGEQTIPAQPGGGVGTWAATVAADGYTWTIVGTGTVNGVTRTVQAQATNPSSTTVTDTGVWNYLYADSTSGNGTCETTINGGTTTSVPLLVHDSLCISGGAHFLGSQLKVAGNLSISGGSNIGTSSASRINTLQVGGNCTVNGVTTRAGSGVCNGATSPVWATSASPTLDVTTQMPALTLSTQYNTQKSLAKSGCPANLLDNDSTLNNSLSSATLTAAMFPSNSSYDCKIGSNEIKWNAVGQFCGTGTLTVTGTIIFDGSLNMGCGWKVYYTGQASLYFTGTINIAGGDSFCGITNCTTSWNPDTNGIILVAGCWANSTGSSLVTSSCVHYTAGAKVQAGSYATTQYTIDGGASNMGPVLASTLSISGGGNSLIPFHTMPPGTPLNTRIVNLPAQAPNHWAG